MATIIGRAAALDAGLPHYFTGKPCRRGHIALRRVHGECVECRRAYKLETGETERDIKRLEALKVAPGFKQETRKAGKVATLRRTPAWRDKAACRAVYQRAAEMTASTGIQHHVDHEIPLRGKLVSGLHVHQNLRVLPWLENVRKSNRFVPG